MLLVGAMTALGLMRSAEGLWVSFAVLAAFGPSGGLAPGGWRRRAAEALLLPVAAVAVLVSSAAIRQMMVAPMVLLAVWAAWSAGYLREQLAPMKWEMGNGRWEMRNEK